VTVLAHSGLAPSWRLAPRPNGLSGGGGWSRHRLRCKPKRAAERQGLALLYPALEWSVFAPGHHGYPRAPDLILGKALRGRLCHQITGATARPFLHLLNPTRRLSGYSSPCQLRDGRR